MSSDTPETDRAIEASPGQWSFALRDTSRKLERERDEARRLAAFYKSLACDYQEEYDEHQLPWEEQA